MPILPALLAPAALMASVFGAGADNQGATAHEVTEADGPRVDFSARVTDWLGLSEMQGAPVAHQVRIEGRVILRIVPRPSRSRSELIDQFAPVPVRVIERPAKKCLAMGEIAGVADRGDRLMLFLRNNRVLVANLERACSPRDFYRGFYLEKSDDGMMCAGRDRLRSRSGATCQLEGLRELVEIVDPR